MHLKLQKLKTPKDIRKYTEYYNLNYIDNKYICNDSDWEELCYNNGINLIDYIDVRHTFKFTDDYEPVGFDYGDYLYTAHYHQDDKDFFYKVYAVFNGVGVDEGIELF